MVLIYDGDCGFCTTTAKWVERRVGDDVAVEPWQSLDLDAYGLTVEEVMAAAYWVDADGMARSRHLAVAGALQAIGLPWKPVGWLIERRPISWLAAVAYRLIAANRYRLPGSTEACRFPQTERAGTAPTETAPPDTAPTDTARP